MRESNDYCSRLSEEVDEPLAGTAAVAEAWLLLEIHESWGRQVPGEAELPARARAQLATWSSARPGLRIQFIRRPSRVTESRRVFFVALDAPGVRVAERELADLDALAELDLDALAAEAVDDGPATYFVCTHGTRDRCCAKWGMPVYQALARLRPQRTWQTSHLGGHRFAPTLLALPAGLVFGRVREEEAEALVEAAERGEVYDTDRLRGRIDLSVDAQVADIALRRASGEARVAAIRSLGEPHLVEGGASHVVLEHGTARHDFLVERLSGPECPGSCGEPPERRRVSVARPRIV